MIVNKVKEIILSVWEFLKGKKTNIAGIAGLIYGVLQNDPAVTIISLGLLGLRHGIASEIAKLIEK